MRRALGGLTAALVMAAMPQAAAALPVWSFVMTPLTVTVGQATVFTMTATNVAGPDDLGCVRVTVPSSFTINAVGDPAATNGEDWQATLNSSTVWVQSLSGGGRLEVGDSVTFPVTATPTVAGVTSWANRAQRHQDCSGVSEFGAPVQVVALPTIVATPAPTIQPTPTPRPTPTPIPLPSLPGSLLPLPSLLPSSSSAPTARPSAQPTALPSDRPATASPAASESASPTSPSGGSASPTSPGSGGGQPPSTAPPPRILPAGAAPVLIGGDVLTVLDGFDTWSVPAAVVSVPGLLVVLWVALQTAGALAWVPAVRRLRGDRQARAEQGRAG
ncbi:MAG TPA: hypothetical protein VFY43_08990 [Candidatus Limnocylindria bacterium]|nr:hypothetical protein [Candidatus Limnocylindria bacterium]